MSAVGSVVTDAHDAVVPSVVKYLPPLPVWLGNPDGAADHLIPAACAESAVSR